MFERHQVAVIAQRMRETNNPLMQFIIGPRQTGKSTMFVQALHHVDMPCHVANADDVVNPDANWLQIEWQQARNLTSGGKAPAVFVVDEIQKVQSWSTVVKGLYDRDRREGTPLKVMSTGPSSLLLHKGLEESLMGRYELIRSPHWSYRECSEAFDFSFEDYLYHGGYPGAAPLVSDDARWRNYIRDAIVEPAISRDVLSLENIRKPALMRALFWLAASYSGQELSYSKMVGQLQDAGNTVTVAGYLDLLGKAGLVTAIPKFSDKELAKRRSTPRLMVYDTAFMTALGDKGRAEWLEDSARRGHLVESAVGARLLARAPEEGFEVMWWREGVKEVDFVLRRDDALSAIEVKSGGESGQSGMSTLLKKYPRAKRIVVGGAAAGACTVEDFLLDKVPLFN